MHTFQNNYWFVTFIKRCSNFDHNCNVLNFQDTFLRNNVLIIHVFLNACVYYPIFLKQFIVKV